MSGDQAMIGGRLLPLAEAQEIFLASIGPLGREPDSVSLWEAAGRVLAGPVAAQGNVPNHNRSTVDGFAVRASDTFGAVESLPVYLRVTGEIGIGRCAQGSVGPGQAARIPTGGMLPEGADAVVKIEDVSERDGEIEIRGPEAPNANVIGRGEDLSVGDTLFGRGHRLRPQDIGLLASLGVLEAPVITRPRVAVISTGAEVVPASEEPGPAQVRDANGYALAAAVAADGGQAEYLGIVPDLYEETAAILKRALEYDLVLISGGSSVGTRDMTVRCLESIAPSGLLVHGVNIRPGKPVALAVIDRVPVLGLPGHPVSALVTYRLFGRPALRKLQGLPPAEANPPAVRARLARSLASVPGREDFYQVRVIRREDTAWAEPILGKSGILSTMALADGWLRIPAGCEGLETGEEVMIYPE